ncbi:hypothetical protein VQ042_11525 [Aurantimonas sp. A2-1-M11]|uniref:hypothetical protein n=1 Tax=Aurantimonas sp. A2-1-M11 TaxID=3113712 RepID=UPI002F939BF9
MTVVVVQPPYTTATCEIVQDEDWLDPLPRFLEGDEPSDLTDVTIEIFIRPVYDHSVLIKKLSTEDGTIVIDDAAGGLASIYVERETVISDIPIGKWDHFCVQSEPFGTLAGGFLRRERFRGPLIVHPGRVAS